MKPILFFLCSLSVLGSCDGQVKLSQKKSHTRETTVKPKSNATGQVMPYSPGTDTNFKKTVSPVWLVSCIYQDKLGNYWFATLGDGVCCFDGNKYTWFTTANGLCDNYVWTIQEDKTVKPGEVSIWFGTRFGVCHYDGKKLSGDNAGFTKMSDVDVHGRNMDFLYHIDTIKSPNDDLEALWFGTHDGAYRYSNGKLSYFQLPGMEPDIKLVLMYPQFYSTQNWVSSVFRDKAGNIWFGTDHRGACRYDGKPLGDRRKHFTWFTEKGLSQACIRCICRDKSGNVWFGTDSGLVYKYDGSALSILTDNKGKVFSSPPTDSQSTGFILSMAEDGAGNLWIGTNSGAWKYNGQTLTHFTKKDGFADNKIYSVFKDKTGDIWFGAYCKGVYKFDGKSFQYLTREGFEN